MTTTNGYVHIMDVIHHLPHTPASDWLHDHLYDTDIAWIGSANGARLDNATMDYLLTAYEGDHHLRASDMRESLRLLSVLIGC